MRRKYCIFYILCLYFVLYSLCYIAKNLSIKAAAGKIWHVSDSATFSPLFDNGFDSVPCYIQCLRYSFISLSFQ